MHSYLDVESEFLLFFLWVAVEHPTPHPQRFLMMKKMKMKMIPGKRAMKYRSLTVEVDFGRDNGGMKGEVEERSMVLDCDQRQEMRNEGHMSLMNHPNT